MLSFSFKVCYVVHCFVFILWLSKMVLIDDSLLVMGCTSYYISVCC